MSSPGTRRKRSWLGRFLYLLLGALFVFYAWTCLQIVRQSHQDEARSADAIVVFGAAQYAGKPSPVLRARLDHAYDLYERKLAPLVIVTGGSGRDPLYSEGGVGRDYLSARGITDRHLIAETQSDNTAESAARVTVIMRANGFKDCIAVSDAYHLYRIKRLMEARGILTYTSPRQQPTSISVPGRAGTVLREALSYTLWRLHIT
jgi:uncharacterized SAM-binding protein YcdF (DUF218 family)